MNCKRCTVIPSTNVNDIQLLCKVNPMFIMWIVLLVALLGAVSPMIAHESGEILGPESGFVDLRWRSDDKILALKCEYDFKDDKLNYNYGEIITVTYDIRVDTASRGYMPNRTYYLLSSHVTGHQISGSEPYYWRIVKSDIDTLEVITDDRALQGELTLQLVHYRDKSKPVQMVDGGFSYFTPIDTTRVVSSKTSRPPAIFFNAYRVTTKQEGANVYQHRSGKFYYDQQGGMGLTGKTLDERTKKIFKSDSYVPPDKNNNYIPPQPDFPEIAASGILPYPIKVLKNTTLKWKIANSNPSPVITAVDFIGNALGCIVIVNPANTTQYILTTGNVTGDVRVTFEYTYNGGTYTGYNDHRIISYYNFNGTITYNDKNTSIDYSSTAFIGRVVLWGRDSYEDPFEIIGETTLTSSANGYFGFSHITSPIIKVGFYVEYNSVPIVYFHNNVGGEDVYYQYKNGAGFHHPESFQLCNDQLTFHANYRIMLLEGQSPQNVYLNDIGYGVIRFRDSMSCGALNIANQMKRLENFFSSQYGVQLNYPSMDLVVLLERTRPYVGNAYTAEGGGIVSGGSAISYRGCTNDATEPIIAWSNSVILHELTHLVHHKLMGVTIGSTSGCVWAGPQLFTDLENQRKIAYIEGFAFYIPCLIQKETPHMFWDAPLNEPFKFVKYIGHELDVHQAINIETGQLDNNNTYPRYEYYYGSVACILWDLSDNSNDTHTATYNYDLIDFTTPEVYGKISYNSPNGCPQKLSHFLHRMWTSNLMNDDTKDKFRLLCSRRSVPKSLYENYRLSVGPEGMYQSISAAVAASCDGDVILIEPSVYEESLFIDKSISLEGDSANAYDTVVIGAVSIDQDQMVDVKNISFSNPEGIGIEVVDSFVSLENVNIENCDGSGLHSSNPEKMKLISCRITGNAGDGIQTSEIQNPTIVDWGIVQGSLVADNNVYGIRSWTPLILDSCTISGNQYGINDLNHMVINSIIYGNNNNLPVAATAPNITYSCIGGGYNGNGNINTNPRFVNSSIGDYALLWDSQGPSPCIDSGFSGLNGADTDPDGTVKDMGCFYYEHASATYEYEVVPNERKIVWQCFPVVDDVSCPNGEYWNELGYLFRNHTTVPNPQLRNIDWYYDGVQDRMDYSGMWNNSDHRVSSTKGYKLCFEVVPNVDDIYVQGFRSDHLTTPTAMKVFINGQRQENWVGYYLQDTQNVWQSLSKPVYNDPDNRSYLDYIYQIKAQKWGAIRLKPKVDSPWIMEHGDYTISEGDMLVLELIEGAPEEFFWNPTLSVSPVVRSDPSNFTYEEKLDYTQCYIKLNPNDMPSEIGLFVDDVCLGAAVVEDSLVQVNLYMDDNKEEGRLEVVFFYEGKGRSLKNEYSVFNNDKMIFEKTELFASMIRDFAYISFIDGEGSTLVPLVTTLEQNYPNPFNPSTSISFALSDDMPITLDVYNIKGQRILTMLNGKYTKGRHTLVWNGTDQNNRRVGSGIYFYKLETPEKRLVKKMTLIK